MGTQHSFGLGLTALTAAVLFAAPVGATNWAVGGAWRTLDREPVMELVEPVAKSQDTGPEVPLAFAATSTTLTESALTIGYSLPALGIYTLDAGAFDEGWTEQYGSALNRGQPIDMYGTYSASLFGGEVGVFGGVADSRSAFTMEPTTSRTVGASVGYAGFYLRGAYQAAGPDGLLDSRRAWQAGLGYGSEDFDVRVTYVQSAFMQGSPTELEGKQWMIGGLVQLTPSILLNANAFYIDREMIVPTVEPPGAGARVGLQLRF